MKLPQENELMKLKITFYRLVNFILSVGVLSASIYGIFLLGQAIFG